MERTSKIIERVAEMLPLVIKSCYILYMEKQDKIQQRIDFLSTQPAGWVSIRNFVAKLLDENSEVLFNQIEGYRHLNNLIRKD